MERNLERLVHPLYKENNLTLLALRDELISLDREPYLWSSFRDLENDTRAPEDIQTRLQLQKCPCFISYVKINLLLRTDMSTSVLFIMGKIP